MRDPQKNRVYRWESVVLDLNARDRTLINLETANSLVKYIFEQERLDHPPLVSLLSKKFTATAGRGNRNTIQLKEQTKTWTVLHELSHTMTFDNLAWFDNDPSRLVEPHGKEFVGVYMKLLDKYMNIPLALLMYTAKENKIEFDLSAKPFFEEKKYA